MEPAARRLECLRAATHSGGSSAAVARSPASQPLYSPGTPNTPQAAFAPGGSYTVGGRTCYVGPRGGTYTITASGRKNYSGC